MIQNTAASNLSEPLKNFLISYGFPRSKVEGWTRETRLYHDLNWYGDSLDEDLGAIFRHFNVDVSGFAESGACPPMGSLDGLIVMLFGWTTWGRKVKDNYHPITFEMVEDAIERGRW